jgi:hypothetical protein
MMDRDGVRARHRALQGQLAHREQCSDIAFLQSVMVPAEKSAFFEL